MDVDEFAAQNNISIDDLPQLLHSVAIGHYNRYKTSGRRNEIDAAILMARESLHRINRDDESLSILNNLGVFLESRYERTKETRDLKEAIDIARQALDATPQDHPDRVGRLNSLATKLGIQYERTEEIQDLEEAINIAKQAVDATPQDHPERAGYLSNLGEIFRSRYKRTEEIWDLEEAIDIARQAVLAAPLNHPDRAGWLNNLGIQLEIRYERTEEIRTLIEAIDIARQAVRASPPDYLNRAACLNNLGTKLERRYERIGEIQDLEEAIGVVRQAVDATPQDHPDRVGWLNNLGNKLERRYERTGEMQDLEEAINIVRQAVVATPADHPDRAGRLNNLGNKLEIRYERTEEIQYLEEAIDIAGQAVDATSQDHPDRIGWLNNLGTKLERRFERTGEIQDLEEAIGVVRQAVDATPRDHPNRAGYLSNLGYMLGSRYVQTEEMRDLEEAIKIARQAVHVTPQDHPNCAGRLNNLGIQLERRYKQIEEMADLEKATECLQNAVKCLSALPLHRVRAAARCMKLLALQVRVDEGIEIGDLVLDLIPAVFTRLLTRLDQQFILSAFAGVASDLCAFLLSTGRLHDALQCLERGRAIIISQMLDDRSDLSALSQNHRFLAEKYRELVDKLSLPIPDIGEIAARDQTMIRRREATAELAACLREIRAIPGYKRFLLGQTVAEIQACAAGGYIVVVNVTDFRSDAIIVSQQSVELVSLSNLAVDDARIWLGRRWQGKLSEEAKLNSDFLQYLSWLWHTCVMHVIDRITVHHRPLCESRPRVWWIGCGLASTMPFHAAGVHSDDSTECAYNKVVSSYTPSVKALFHARQQARRAKDRIAYDVDLIATMQTTPKGLSHSRVLKPLPGVIKEKDAILKAMQSTPRRTILAYPSAEQILSLLPRCRIAHFACHGISDRSNPSNSGLILQRTGSNGTPEQDFLSVYRISQSRLSSVQIAYLSACSTAENNSAQLSDEVIHVVSGFQVAGFPHVVGCLWPAGDLECVEVAKAFYSSIFRDGQSNLDAAEIAWALQKAVMEVRRADISMPLNWAQFVHFGA